MTPSTHAGEAHAGAPASLQRSGLCWTTAAEAVSLVRPGCRILIGSGAAEPRGLVEALTSSGARLADNEIIHILTLGPAPYVAPEMAGRFRHRAFFIGPNVRRAVQEGRADFVPVFLSEVPQLIRSRRVGIDVALIQTTPPDAHGFVSLGVSVDVVRAAVDTAQLVLAEINPRMPRTHGDSFLHVSKIAKLVWTDVPLPEVKTEAPGEVADAIGHHVARLIADGATLQLGIGSIPDAVLGALGKHKDLGIHTEMLSDGVMRLFERGVLTGARKSLLPGKMVASFVMGSSALYAWAHDNPALEMRGSDYTNDPFVIAQNDQMVSINSALAVDLTGQVAADTLSGRFFSGIGGQVDFVRGAARSRGGKSIIAMRSTAKDGAVSRIVPVLEAGAGVVTSRGDVRYVVTEYGVADLWGKSIRERALSLSEVAHPSFRAELLAAAKERRYVFADQQVPVAIYPWREETRERLLDGSWIGLRPIRMSDQEEIQRMLYSLSDESTYRRFLAHKRVHPREEMQELVDTDYDKSMGLVAELEGGALVGLARYDVEPDTDLAEVAFVVCDAWQNKGIGTLLLKRMSEMAKARGLRGLCANVLSSNRPMLLVFQRSGLHVQSHFDGAVVRLQALFEAPARATPELAR